jgi:hypothetical protein
MRAKVVLSASGLALLILVPAIYFHLAPSSPPPDQSAPAPVAAADQASTPPAPRHHLTIGPANGGEGVPAPDAAADLSASDHANYVVTRRGELTQMGMSDDPSDLKTILSELNSRLAKRNRMDGRPPRKGGPPKGDKISSTPLFSGI